MHFFKQSPSCSDRPMYPLASTIVIFNATFSVEQFFSEPQWLTCCPNRPRHREKLSKFKLKLIDRAKFDQRWSVQKTTVGIRAVFVPTAVCRVQKRQRVPSYTAQGGTHISMENIPNMTHSEMEKLIESNVWKCGRVFPASLSSVAVQYNLCATDTPSKHNVFHVLSSLQKRLNRNYF